METVGEAGFHTQQIGHRQELLHLELTAATIPLRRFWILSLLQYLVCLLHHRSSMATETTMDIADHPVQVQMGEAMGTAMGWDRRETNLMGMGAEEDLKVAANITARLAEETSTTMAIHV
jgi:hypothetical protein